MPESIEVKRFSDLAKREFNEKFLEKGVPVVIENHLKNLPCAKWSMDYLLDKLAGNEVNVRGRTDSEEYKVGRCYTLRKTTFGEYIKDLRKGNFRGRSSYMAVQNINKVFPQLTQECALPEFVGKVHNGPFLWIAHHGHYEYCHFDPDEGMLMMIEGMKEITMFPCSDLEKLYPNPLGSRGKTIQSRVDCKSPDLETFPNFQNATGFHCVLNPGDMLYIPAFWWHQVTSITNAVSMNVFFGDEGENNYITRHMEGASWSSFKWWLLNIVEQNKGYASFARTLERLHICVEYLLLKQFHETPTSEQLNYLVQVIMEYLRIHELPQFTGGGKHPPPLKIRGLRWR